MPIQIACHCGESISVKDELQGKAVACPKCGKTVRVASTSARSAMEELLDEVGFTATRTGRKCAECGSDLSADAIICIQCGLNTETGKKLQTKREIVDRKKPFGHR